MATCTTIESQAAADFTWLRRNDEFWIPGIDRATTWDYLNLMSNTNTNRNTESLTAEQHGASDADTAICDATIQDERLTGRQVAQRMLRDESEGPDSGLINATGWAGVYKLSGLASDGSDEPTEEVLAWCERYNAGWLARVTETAKP